MKPTVASAFIVHHLLHCLSIYAGVFQQQKEQRNRDVRKIAKSSRKCLLLTISAATGSGKWESGEIIMKLKGQALASQQQCLASQKAIHPPVVEEQVCENHV